MRRRNERGMVTVELAIGMLAATILSVILAWVIGLVSLQARCADAAAQVARATSRGDDSTASSAVAKAPKGATFEVSKGPGQVRVRVRLTASVLWMPAVPITAEATSPLEPGQR